MRIPRIYSTSALSIGGEVALDASASQHLSRALRMNAGDAIVIFDGAGACHSASIVSIDKRRVVVAIGAALESSVESPLQLELGIALSRGDRMDWVIQKATELGVSTIAPLFTERSEVKLSGERAEKKLRHWRQIAISACEQCGRNTLPSISPAQTLTQWQRNVEADSKLVLHHRASAGNTATTEKPCSIALLIGPEGGLSAAEIDGAEALSFRAMQLGPRVLRTETAPLAALAILQARWGDMTPQL